MKTKSQSIFTRFRPHQGDEDVISTTEGYTNEIKGIAILHPTFLGMSLGASLLGLSP